VPTYERITVSFSRQASDGNYGSETVRVELVVVADEGEALDELHAAQALSSARAMVHTELRRSPSYTVQCARAMVHTELRRSPSYTVQRAVEPRVPPEAAEADDDEDLPL
jgi:hypothetical protein